MDFLKLFWRAYNGQVLIVAFLMGLFASVLVCLQLTLGQAEETLKGSLGVVVFLQNDMSASDAEAWMTTAKAADSEILSIEYTSKEDALKSAMQDPKLSKSLQLLKANPLPASFRVNYSELAWVERAAPAQALSSSANIQEIRWDSQAHSLFRSLRGWRQWMMRVSAFVGMIVFVWAMKGLYRYLAQGNAFPELASQLAVGLVGGVVAWGLWSFGMQSFPSGISPLNPVWVWLIPMIIGIVSALGSFGPEVEHAS